MALSDDRFGDISASEYEQDIVRFQDLFNELQQPIDTVAESEQFAREANERAAQRALREQSRYGINLTPVERQQQSRLMQMTGQANIAGAGNFARRRDEDANLQRLGLLSGLYSQARQQAFSNLGTLGQLMVNRKNTYEGARANARSQGYSFLGSLGRTLGNFLGGGI